MKTLPICPKCNSNKVVSILYGLPSPGLEKEAEEGKIALGGCEVIGDEPQWSCQNCRNEWRDLRTA